MTRSRQSSPAQTSAVLKVGVQREVTGDDVHRFDKPGAGAGHVERVKWPRAQAPRDLSRGRGLEVLAGNAAINQKVDLGRLDTVLARGKPSLRATQTRRAKACWSGSR